MEGPPLHFGILGPLLVEHRGRAIPAPGSTVLRRLLVVLLAAPRRAVPASQLIALVWSGRSEDVRPSSLHVAISRLRRWLTDLDPALVIEHENDGYRLAVESRAVDLSRLIELAAEARQAGDPAQQCDLLGEATAMCRGRPMADLEVGHTGDPLVCAVREAVRTAVLAYSDVALEAGRPHVALDALTRHIEREPLDEPAHARLIRLLSACGRQAEALARFGTLRTLLAEELGVDPSDELQRAHLAVLAQDRPVADRLPPSLLPHDLADFIGRGELLRVVLDELARKPSGPMPIVVLTGRGGIGKTTLAVHAAHGLRDRYPDGQLFVDLHGAEARTADPAEVLVRFLRVLGLDSKRLPDTLEERAELYRNALAHKRVLVVLDNAASERQVRHLLPGGSHCGVLVTSRRQLAGLGARPVRLNVLAKEEAVDLFGRIVGGVRVAAEPAAAGEIVRLCGYLPLAVRIAGCRLARLPHRTLAWLAARLSDDRQRLDELAMDDLEVRASLDLSYGELGPAARLLFTRLGLLDAPDVAGWVAAALLETDAAQAAEALDQLVDTHLLDATRDGSAGEIRYRQHDVVRVYARERAETAEPARLRSAAVARALTGWLARAHLADGCLRHRLPRFASADPPGPDSTSPPADPLAWFERERPALVAAVTQAHRVGADDLCWHLATRLDGFFETGSHYDDWATTHAAALRAADRAGSRGGAARIRYALGEMHADRDQYEPALRHFRRAQELLASTGDRLAVAHVRRAAGVAERMLGEMHAARADLEAALEVFIEYGDRLGIADAAHGLGAIDREQGRLDEARSSYEHALALFEELGDEFTQAIVLCSLGNVHRLAGQAGAAEDCLRRSLVLSRRLRNRPAEVFARCYLGELHAELGQPEQARDELERARALCEEVDERFGLGLTLRALGELYYATGDVDGARKTLLEALQIWRELDAPIWQARVLETLGRVQHDQGRDADALAAWSTSLELFRALQAPEADRVAAQADRLRAGALPDPPDPGLPQIVGTARS